MRTVKWACIFPQMLSCAQTERLYENCTCAKLCVCLIMQICRQKNKITTSAHRQKTQKTPCRLKLLHDMQLLNQLKNKNNYYLIIFFNQVSGKDDSVLIHWYVTVCLTDHEPYRVCSSAELLNILILYWSVCLHSNILVLT